MSNKESARGSASNKDSARGSVSKKKKKQLNDSLDHESYLQALKEIEEDDLDLRSLKTVHSGRYSEVSASGRSRNRKKPQAAKPAQTLANGATQNTNDSSAAPKLSSRDATKTILSPKEKTSAKRFTNCCWPLVRKHSSSQVTQDPEQMDVKESPRMTSVDFTAVGQEQRPLVPQIEVDSFRRSQGSMASFTDRPSSRMSGEVLSFRGNVAKSRPLEYERNRR